MIKKFISIGISFHFSSQSRSRIRTFFYIKFDCCTLNYEIRLEKTSSTSWAKWPSERLKKKAKKYVRFSLRINILILTKNDKKERLTDIVWCDPVTWFRFALCVIHNLGSIPSIQPPERKISLLSALATPKSLIACMHTNAVYPHILDDHSKISPISGWNVR